MNGSGTSLRIDARNGKSGVCFGHMDPNPKPKTKNGDKNMIKTRREPEISKRRHPAGRSKSEKTMQPLDGTVQSPAHPDPQPENPQRTEKVVESKGTHAVVAGPGGAPEDSELAELRAQWQKLSALERTKRLEVLMAKGHSKRALARAIGCSEGSIRWHLNFSHLKSEEKQAFQQGELS